MPSSDKLVTVTAPVLPTGAAAAPFVPLKARKKGAHGAASSPQSLAEPAVCRMPSIGAGLCPQQRILCLSRCMQAGLAVMIRNLEHLGAIMRPHAAGRASASLIIRHQPLAGP